jgi:hypothetical protein
VIDPNTEIGWYEGKKLISSNTRGAHMTINAKDHKDRNEDGTYKIRPIASVHDTPVDKLDFIAQHVLTQLLQFIPTHITNAEQLLADLSKVDLTKMSNPGIFSVDVESLYPSIPIHRVFDEIEDFLWDHWEDIDHFGMTIEQFRGIISFIGGNYEVQFAGKNFLQTKGVPMGARYAPPLAILFMYMLERKTLTRLRSEGTDIKYYGRYIDDTIILLEKGDDFSANAHKILDTFNKEDPAIKFTMELPNKEGELPFLDVLLKIKQKRLSHGWYVKSLHSGNLLHANSYVPQLTKINFITNRFHNVLQNQVTVCFWTKEKKNSMVCFYRTDTQTYKFGTVSVKRCTNGIGRRR